MKIIHWLHSLIIFFITQSLFAQKPIIGLYHEKLATILQTLNGPQFLSQGGTDFVDYMVSGIDLNKKRVLDYGCGLCGPAQYLAKKYNVYIDGIDVDPRLIEKSQSIIKDNSLESLISLHLINDSTLLPFSDETFDVVFSKESIVHVHNKRALLKEFYRILKPGGQLIIADWFKKDISYNAELNNISNIYDAVMAFCSHQVYAQYLNEAGFIIHDAIETSRHHLQFTEQDYQELFGQKGKEIEQIFGKQALEGTIQCWISNIEVLKSGEIQTYLFRAQKK